MAQPGSGLASWTSPRAGVAQEDVAAHEDAPTRLGERLLGDGAVRGGLGGDDDGPHVVALEVIVVVLAGFDAWVG